MSLIANRMGRVTPSATLTIKTKVSQMKAAGIDVIGLSVGEPDFDTPTHICEAAKAAIDTGETRYTPVGGTNALKNAIIAKFQRDNGLTFTGDQIIASTGGKQVLYNAFQASLNTGDEVIIPAPYWVSYPAQVLLAEGKPVIVPTREDNGFRLDPITLDTAITPKTKWLVLNSPSNPTGGVYAPENLTALAEILRKYPQVHIMVDDIYEHLTYDGEFVSLAQVAPDLLPRMLIINGVSKAYAMTGWRLGYGAGPEHLIKAMTKLQGQSTSNPSSITQAAAVAALNGDHGFLKDWKAAFIRRRDRMVSLINDIEGLRCRSPEGAFYLYVNCDGLIGKSTPNNKILENDTDISLYLLEEAKVAVVPGEAFGLSSYFRLSYAVAEETLIKAAGQIAEAVGKLAD